MGGFPAAGPLFGAAYNPEAVMPTSTMIDLIQGGNLDAAVLGCAEVSLASFACSKCGSCHRSYHKTFVDSSCSPFVLPLLVVCYVNAGAQQSYQN